MVLDWTTRHGTAAGFASLGRRLVVLGALLSASGCIPTSSEYPYQAQDAGSDLGDVRAPEDATDTGDAARDAGCDASFPSDPCMTAGATCGTIRAADGCGVVQDVDCGDCASGICGNDNQCCEQWDEGTLCERNGADCGMLTATDNCGIVREDVPCGTCPNGDCMGTTCGVCNRESDVTFCGRYNQQCGTWSGVDNCGEQRTDIPCGSCDNGAMCQTGTCVCPGGTTETTCDDDIDNDCDGLRDCEDDDCDRQVCGPGLGELAPRCRDNDCRAL